LFGRETAKDFFLIFSRAQKYWGETHLLDPLPMMFKSQFACPLMLEPYWLGEIIISSLNIHCVWAGGTKVGDIRSACHDECANGMHL
jgi:hypothetical protein